MSQIAKLEPVEVRALWNHEEHGFSVWLVENLDALGEALGITLLNPQREKAVGRFSLDILAETDNGVQVIIENQLECTNHDHLGKVLTYLSNLDAKVAVWVASEFREEHAEAIRWLNEFTPADVAFYLVKLSAFRIGNSDAAPHFGKVAGPTNIGRSIGQEKKELAERHVLRRKFWEQLLDRARKVGVMTHAQRSASTDHWLSAGAGIMSGVSFTYNIWTDGAAVDLEINSQDLEENKKLFDRMYAAREQIEQSFGSPLLWERMDEKRTSRIRFELSGAGLYDPEETWPAIQQAMIQAMDRLSKSIPRVRP